MDANTEAYVTKQDLPDWSQFATRQDMSELKSELKLDMSELKSELKLDMRELKSELKLDMSEHRSSLIRWMIGIFFGTFTLAGALLSLLLTGMYHLYGLLT